MPNEIDFINKTRSARYNKKRDSAPRRKRSFFPREAVLQKGHGLWAVAHTEGGVRPGA